jgi:SulP family sulfate permease
MDKVVWDALPGQTFTVCSMIFVVALSSSLDIAAIDLEVAKPLAYNYELGMIGISNLVSGLTGGYTGSYIFSQSIFSLRAGIRSRLSGLVAAVIQAISVIMPISILAIVPNFIFASLLIMICVDLMIEWLWDVRKKLSKAEYSVALMTFALIQVLGVAYGIVAGIGYYILLSKIGLLSDAERPESDDAVTTNERSPILKELKEEERTYNSTDTQGEDNELGVTF